MNRRLRRKKPEGDRTELNSDGWILFKRCVLCAIGVLAAAIPLFWALVRDREWSIGMTIMCVIGAAFFALGMFGSRRSVSEADIDI